MIITSTKSPDRRHKCVGVPDLLTITISQSTVVLCIQVNEKSCRLRMGAYRDSVKKERRQDWDGSIIVT